MKRILPPIALLLATATLANTRPLPQDGIETPKLPAPKTEIAQVTKTKQAQTPIQTVRNFVNKHDSLRYTIYDYRKTLGQYSQQTKIVTLKSGREVMDLVDSYNFFRNDEVRLRRTRAWINKHYDIIEVSGEMGAIGKMGAQLRQGKITGINLQGKPFAFDAPEHIVTRDLFQRGFYELPSTIGESRAFEMFALENVEDKEICTKVDVIYKGIEEISAQGVTYKCRRYVARARGEKRAAQYFFGPENRLIVLKTGLQFWELMPKGQKEPLPVVRKANPMRQRKLEKERIAREKLESEGKPKTGEDKPKTGEGDEQED
jgi:hypothetical protein